ncbi:MAG TPA: ATP-dependent DNA helicase PcrA, partial [Erysipelotrichaceae bacterium]|nr:ATP-dependent DNA helicase PcrA [Erysipelotrichaceae bacterium]
SKEEVRAKWQRRFTYLHVDEFQDVDNLQYAIIKLLVKEGSYLCVVGDPDQTIYTWRGAQVDIIMNFERDFPDSHTVVLNENYRS